MCHKVTRIHLQLVESRLIIFFERAWWSRHSRRVSRGNLEWHGLLHPDWYVCREDKDHDGWVQMNYETFMRVGLVYIQIAAEFWWDSILSSIRFSLVLHDIITSYMPISWYPHSAFADISLYHRCIFFPISVIQLMTAGVMMMPRIQCYLFHPRARAGIEQATETSFLETHWPGFYPWSILWFIDCLVIWHFVFPPRHHDTFWVFCYTWTEARCLVLHSQRARSVSAGQREMNRLCRMSQTVFLQIPIASAVMDGTDLVSFPLHWLVRSRKILDEHRQADGRLKATCPINHSVLSFLHVSSAGFPNQPSQACYCLPAVIEQRATVAVCLSVDWAQRASPSAVQVSKA